LNTLEQQGKLTVVFVVHLVDSCSRFNSSLVGQRKPNWHGVYDVHTNVVHYPSITQPTHAKWEPVSPEESATSTTHNDSHDTNLTNGVSFKDVGPSQVSMFEPVSKVVARNFLVTDTVFVQCPINGAGIPGADGDMLAIGANGLPEASEEILAELPPDCRDALLEAKEQEKEWRTYWSTESNDGLRGNLKIGFLGFPV
jgi:chromatin structure-remodeling complex protein RSC7